MATNKEQLQIIVKEQGIAKTKAQLKSMEKATGGATKSFALMAAGIAGATAAMFALGKAVKVGMEFEQAMANVKAVSGATAIQFKALEKNAMQLGATTKFTASEVANLQTEFAKLGFTASEINNVTKGTLDLASAVGAELPEAAMVAGSTLRGFGLSTSETTRVTDVMAKSFSASALDMDKFSNSMTYVAPVAKLAGFSIEGTTAILGKLANAGIDGSMAGTALRRVFLELSNENSKLSQRLGGSVSSVDELVPALIKLKEEGISTAEMKDLVGQRAISAFSILLDGANDLETLTTAFEDAGGSAEKMANIQLDTLQGQLTIMMSALSSLGIKIFKLVDGPLKLLVSGFTFLVNMADDIVRVFGNFDDAQKPLIKTMKDHEDAIRGIIEANKDLTLAQQEQIVSTLQTEVNHLAEQYVLARDAVESYEYQLKGTNIEIDQEYKAIAKIVEQEKENIRIIKEKIDSKSEELAAGYKRINQLKEEKNAQNELNQIQTPEQQAQVLDSLKQYEFASLEIKEQAALKELELLNATEKDKQKVVEFYQKERIKTTLNTSGKLMGAMSQLNSASKGSALVTGRLQQGAIIANTASAAMAAISPPTGAPTPLGFMNMAAVIAAGLAQTIQVEKGLSEMKKAQYGMDEVVSQPTMILAGEAGAEKVEITPLEGPNVDGPQGGSTVNVSVTGNVLTEDFVVGELSEKIREAVRRGVNFNLLPTV